MRLEHFLLIDLLLITEMKINIFPDFKKQLNCGAPIAGKSDIICYLKSKTKNGRKEYFCNCRKQNATLSQRVLLAKYSK